MTFYQIKANTSGQFLTLESRSKNESSIFLLTWHPVIFLNQMNTLLYVFSVNILFLITGDSINDFGYYIKQFGDWKIQIILVISYRILVKKPFNLVIIPLKVLVIFSLNLVINKRFFNLEIWWCIIESRLSFN